MRNYDYSFLFNNTSNSATNSLYSSLSDLYTIKSGTYKKLVSAYYKKVDGEDSKDKSTDSKKNIWDKTSVSSAATELSKSADKIKTSSNSLSGAASALTDTGNASLFKEREMKRVTDEGTEVITTGIDKDAIYSAAKKFTDSYNSFLKTAGDSSSDSVKTQLTSLKAVTATNSSALSKVGITIDKDSKLSIDENKFKQADINTIKSLFNGKNSYAANAATKASMVSAAATSDAELQKIYGSDAKTSGSSGGSLWDSFF